MGSYSSGDYFGCVIGSASIILLSAFFAPWLANEVIRPAILETVGAELLPSFVTDTLMTTGIVLLLIGAMYLYGLSWKTILSDGGVIGALTAFIILIYFAENRVLTTGASIVLTWIIGRVWNAHKNFVEKDCDKVPLCALLYLCGVTLPLVGVGLITNDISQITQFTTHEGLLIGLIPPFFVVAFSRVKGGYPVSMFLAVAGAILWAALLWTSADVKDEIIASELVAQILFIVYFITIFSSPYVSYRTRKDWLLFNSD